MHVAPARRNGAEGLAIVTTARARLLTALLALALVGGGAAGWQLWQATHRAEAAVRTIRLPFAAGPTWVITEGYRTDPVAGGQHFDCEPAMAITACRASWQYADALTFNRTDGVTADETVLAPVSGTIRWIDPASGALAINLSDGFVVGVTTGAIDPALTPGQTVRQGQPVGSTTTPKVARISAAPRIQLALWRAGPGQRLESVPFTGEHALDGASLPETGGENQYRGRAVVSSNEPAGAVGPSAPALKGPENDTRLAATRTRVTLTWHPVPHATAYQVEVNGAAASPWLTSPAWTTDGLKAGGYSWRVRARDASGVGPLSAPFSFTITAPSPSAASGAPGLKPSAAEAEVGAAVHLTGSGLERDERVTLAWDDQPLATARADAQGAFAADIVVPPGPGGNHRVVARGETSGRTMTTRVRVRPSLARGPSSAAPGSEIAIAARGFGANERVTLTWHTDDGARLGTLETDASGNGTVTVALPDGKPGWNDYTGAGQTSKTRAWGAIEITPSLALSADMVNSGDEMTLTARGLPPAGSVGVAFDKTAGAPGTLLCDGKADAEGRFACRFTTPAKGAGTYPVTLTSANGIERTAPLTINGPTAVAITPGATAAGTNVTLALGGFAPREAVDLRLDGHPWRTVKVDARGALALPATVPPLPHGAAMLTAAGEGSGRSASAPFTISTRANSGAGPDVIRPGVYRVTATREGLVGETTSTGHVIVPNDRFVALPACVASNCPWLRAGVDDPIWGVRTECGKRCDVKVVNPANGACAVAPVWDVGPWFRSDDWWRPTAERRLNTKLGSPNTLAQGYPAAEAARLGLDVGYGTGPNGYGASDRYADVGNPAAIDLADGTWNDLGLDFERGIAYGVEVQLLWQTEQTRAAATRGCDAATAHAFQDREAATPGRGMLAARWPNGARAAPGPLWIESRRRRT